MKTISELARKRVSNFVLSPWCLLPTMMLVHGLLSSALVAQTAPAKAQQVNPAIDSDTFNRILQNFRAGARAENATIGSMRSSRDAALARLAAAGAAAPLSLATGLSEAPAANPDQGNLRLEISREFLTGPRRQAERKLAEVDVNAVEIEIAAAERTLDASVVRTTISAAVSRGILARLTQQDQLLTSAEESLRSRFGMGESRYVDVLRMRTERLKIQGERSTAFSDIRRTEIQLTALLGQSGAGNISALLDTLANVAASESLRAFLPAAPSSDSLVALSADVHTRQIDEVRSAAQSALGVAQRKTQLSGYAGVQRIGQANNGPTFGPSIGITMSLPFTASRANNRFIAADRQAEVTATVATAAARSAVRARIESDQERFRSGITRLESFDNALLVGAREERESALSAFRNGDLTLIELLDFERALSEAEIARLRAFVDTFDAWADLVSDGNGDTAASRSSSSTKGR